MSDEEDDDFMQMSEDEEDFSFEYEDEDEDEAVGEGEEEVEDEDHDSVGIINQGSTTMGTTTAAQLIQKDTTMTSTIHKDLESLYYSAKMIKEESLSKAIDQFQVIVNLQSDQSLKQNQLEYIFKSYKQLLKCLYHLNMFDQFLSTLSALFQFASQLTNKTYVESSINKLINHYDTPKSDSDSLSTTLDHISNGVIKLYHEPNLPNNRVIPQDRLWLKLNLKKINLFIRVHEYDQAIQLLESLQIICDTSSETVKGSYMLEIIALQLQMYSSVSAPTPFLKNLYDKSLKINSAVPHPKIMGIIKEFGGEIYMKRSDYNKASNEFYESFKNYDEAGDPKRVQMLRKLMISNMLSENEISPFHSKEFQSFAKLPEIEILLELYNAFINVDHEKFHLLIEQNTNPETKIIFNDPFFTTYMKELKSIIQLKTIIIATKYYSKIDFEYLCQLTHCDIPTLKLKLLQLVSSGKLINLKIDYLKNIVEIEDDHNNHHKNERFIGNIDVEDIIQNLTKRSTVNNNNNNNTMAEIDNDGDQLMEDAPSQDQEQDQDQEQQQQQSQSQASVPVQRSSQQQQQQQQQQEMESSISSLLRDKPDYIKLSPRIIETLTSVLGGADLVPKNINKTEFTQRTIYKVKLQNVLRDWLAILQKAVPTRTEDRLSQIEQVKLEQQIQQQAVDPELIDQSEVEQQTMMGELTLEQPDQTQIQQQQQQQQQQQEQHFPLTQLGKAGSKSTTTAESLGDFIVSAQHTDQNYSETDALNKLIKSIDTYRDQLVCHYDDRAKFAENLVERLVAYSHGA